MGRLFFAKHLILINAALSEMEEQYDNSKSREYRKNIWQKGIKG